MVSYLIIVGVLLSIIVIGIVYSVESDFVDFFIPLYSNSPISSYNTVESNNTFDLLVFTFKYVLVPALLGIIFFAYQMGQKPERNW